MRTDRRLAVALTGLALLLSACGTARPTAGTDPAPSAPTWGGLPDPGFGHVHGLGVDPADGALYAATHYGLWRLSRQPGSSLPGADGMHRVADRFQDTMGFTVTGPGAFLGSGHPDLREPLPGRLGLIRSTDTGRSWQPVSLQGQVDFHALQAAHGRVYGYDATSSTVLVSPDGGAGWRRGWQGELADLAVSPTDPDLLLAAHGRRVLVSRDAGATFTARAGTPGLVALDWTDRLLIGADTRGTVWTSDDQGRSWTRRGRLTGTPQALTVAGSTVYAADRAGVSASRDGGRRFTRLVGYTSRGRLQVSR